MQKKKKSSFKHYRNSAFLEALGRHCQKLRVHHGYSIDRMSKEGEQLSPSVIHRLELGAGAVTVSALYRYAQVLSIHPRQLLDFPEAAEGALQAESRKLHILDADDPQAKTEAFKTLLPFYSLKAAAGHFGSGSAVEKEGWIRVSGHALDRKMFIAQAIGDSMSPLIRNGDYLVFRSDPVGTRQGKVVLAQYRGPADPDTGGAYTVKKYSSVKMAHKESEWRHRQITLSPINADYEPIVLEPKNESDFKIVAEYLFSL